MKPIDNQQLNQRRIAARQKILAVALMVLIGCFYQIRKGRKQGQDLFLYACD